MNADSIIDAAARFAKETQGQPVASQGVTPQPCPMTVQLAGVRDNQGKNYIALVINHLTGQSIYHFEPDGAERLAKAMLDAVQAAKTGLEIPRLM